MGRRDFLLRSGWAALGFPALSLMASAQERQNRHGAPWANLIAELDKQIFKMMGETVIPGLSIAVIKDAHTVWRRTFGVKDNESRKPVENDTVFEAGSMSKPVFAYAVMKLCEKGVIDLDTPLTKYSSERFLEGDPRLDLLTARHLLSHTSGFRLVKNNRLCAGIRKTI
jgi:CubicO group peptidase (beta-lactamase class C family)